MRLYTVLLGGREEVAAGRDGKVVPVRSLGVEVRDMVELIRTPQALALVRERLGRGEGEDTDMGEVRILSPIVHPVSDIVCLGLNYREHIDETVHVEDFTHKEATVYFSKHASRISGTGENIPSYSFVDSLDYEVELGAVLGRDVRDYCPGRDPDPVFGYTVFNDVSARNLQFLHKQWYRGKSLDGYSVMGPCLVTPDELGDPGQLEIVCEVNGEVRQKSRTSALICTVHEAIADVTRGMTLEAGTILATGTPGGVALGMKEPKYLRPGDRVVCRIEKIGEIVSTVV